MFKKVWLTFVRLVRISHVGAARALGALPR